MVVTTPSTIMPLPTCDNEKSQLEQKKQPKTEMRHWPMSRMS